MTLKAQPASGLLPLSAATATAATTAAAAREPDAGTDASLAH